jgi:hypothetical protein
MSYRIEKAGQYLTGNIKEGRYEYTAFFAYRYLFDEKVLAEKIAVVYGGMVVRE